MKKMSSKIDKIIQIALAEDACRKDVTSRLLIPKNHQTRAVILLKEDAVLCGLSLARDVFQVMDKKIKFHSRFRDGQKIKKNTVIAGILGETRVLLAGERTALNFLGHLCGIATQTRKFVEAIHPFPVKIFDTRKTTPGLRLLEKYAVKCGGGFNHRLDLSGEIFVKDNHWAAASGGQSLPEMIQSLRKRSAKTIIAEVENLSQLAQILKCPPDIVVLDNMSLGETKKAVAMVKTRPPGQRPQMEVSGGVGFVNIRAFAKTGVHRISIGALTHTVRSVDVSLEIINS